MPVTRASARHPGTALTSRIVNRPRSMSGIRLTPAISAPRLSREDRLPLGFRVEGTELSSSTQRHVRSPFAGSRMPAH